MSALGSLADVENGSEMSAVPREQTRSSSVSMSPKCQKLTQGKYGESPAVVNRALRVARCPSSFFLPAAADKLREQFNCFVNIVDHPGWDTTRLRGHSSLQAGVDVELEITSPNKGSPLVTCF